MYRWAAFGIGKKMLDSSIYVFWKNSAGDCVVSGRKASSYTQPPRVNKDQVEKITDLDSSVSSQAKGADLKCTMTRPLDLTPAMDKDFIWAIGTGVADVNDAESNFDGHSEQGKLVLNTNAKNATNSKKTKDTKKTPSGATMSTLSIFAFLASLLVL
jgi:hypothetical protein